MTSMRANLKIFATTVAVLLGSPFSAAAAELVMVEQRGCIWCARWNAEIAEIYPRTPEGSFAPLRRIELNGDRPADLTFSGPLRITPTFVLIEDGVEVARLEGYPGEDFFWAVLEQMLVNNTNFQGGNDS